MEDILKKKCSTWKVPSMRQLKEILKQSKECQEMVRDRVEKVEKRIAMLDGEDKWMSRFEDYKENR